MGACGACDSCGCESEWLVKSIKAEPRAQPAVFKPSASATNAVATDVDSELREYLREWRRAAAKQQGVPAFVVMHDTSLDELCRKRPGSMPELLRISGFGEHKAGLYGRQIFDALERFRSGARASASPDTKPRPARRASGL